MHDTRFILAISMALAAGLLSGQALAEARAAEIECEANEEYYLCEAKAAGPISNFSWSVSGELRINLASGPLVSVGCPPGESGTLHLEMDGPDGKREASLHLDCVLR